MRIRDNHVALILDLFPDISVAYAYYVADVLLSDVAHELHKEAYLWSDGEARGIFYASDLVNPMEDV